MQYPEAVRCLVGWRGAGCILEAGCLLVEGEHLPGGLQSVVCGLPPGGEGSRRAGSAPSVATDPHSVLLALPDSQEGVRAPRYNY
jgi:hypothetical protein